MSDLGKTLWEIYLPRFEYHFADHPEKDEIIRSMREDRNTPEQIEQWFNEASSYTFEKKMSHTQPDNGDGTVTYEIYRGGNDGGS